MKIRLDDVMQSFSYPFEAVYYYYIPLETVLMFVNGMILGKAVHGISSEKDAKEHRDDMIRLPEIGSEGRMRVMRSFIRSLSDPAQRERLDAVAIENGERFFESALREEKLLIPWYNYRDEVYRELSKRWCDENDLELIV